MNTIHEEQKIVRAAQQGKQEAKDQLCEKYYPEIFRIARLILKDWNESQDAVQEVFCRVFVQDKIKGFKGEASLKSWLVVVTRNVCFTHIRKKNRILKKVSVLNFLDSCEDQVQDKSYVADEKLIQIEENKLLNHAVGKLPDKYRQVIEYRYFDDYSYKEAANRMGITATYFGLIKVRAEERLEKIMTELHPDTGSLRSSFCV